MKRLELVEWKDICGLNDFGEGRITWASEPEMTSKATQLYALNYSTVGYIVHENDDFLVIAASWDGSAEEPFFHDASMIPKVNITTRIPLAPSVERG